MIVVFEMVYFMFELMPNLKISSIFRCYFSLLNHIWNVFLMLVFLIIQFTYHYYLFECTVNQFKNSFDDCIECEGD